MIKQATFAGVFAALCCLAPSISAAAPARRPYHVDNYAVRLEIDPARNLSKFDADAEIRLRAESAIDGIELDAQDLTVGKVLQVKPDLKPLTFKVDAARNLLTVHFPRKMRRGETWSLVVQYKGKIRESHDGFFKVVDPDDKARGPIYSTMFESDSARKFFPCNDRPDEKATSEVEATVPVGWDVISNGKQVSDRPFDKKNQHFHVVHWKMTKPHATYLVSLAIGKFRSVNGAVDGTPVLVWTGPTKTDKAKYTLEATEASLHFFNDYLGVRYPWPKYGIVLIPTFLWGGMENTTSTHQNEDRSLLLDPKSEMERSHILELSAHELAHQWFGDYVTMAWWDDVWLNEAFASLMATEASTHVQKNNEAEIETVVGAWENYFRQEDGPRSHPIVDKGKTSTDDDFDDITYTKGEQVLRMVKAWIGEAAFRKGLQSYLDSHAYANATYVDFFAAMEKASLKPMAAFRDSWLLNRGYPVVTYDKGQWDGGAKTFTVTLKQRPNHKEDKTLFQIPVPIAFHRKAAPAYDKTVMVMLDQARHQEKVALPDEPEWFTVNPGGAALALVTPDDRDEDKLAALALHDPDALARIGASFDLARGLKEGDSISGTAQKTLVDVLKEDPSPYVRIAVLRDFAKIKSRHLPGRVGDGVFQLARESQQADFQKSAFFTADPHGARLYRSELLGACGRVDNGEVMKFLGELLAKKDLPLDDLGKASLAVAQIGEDKSRVILKDTLKLHAARGNAYEHVVAAAFGAYESPKATDEIAELIKTGGPDLLSHIGSYIRDNQTLKNSSEWAKFVQTFVLNDARFGDEVKSRLLETIEEVKSDTVKAVLQTIEKETKSTRLQEDTHRILGKNFSS